MNAIAQLANPLWQNMCFFAYAFLVFAWLQAHKGKIAVFDSARYIIFLLALLTAISFSKDLFLTGTSLINAEAEVVSNSIELFLDNVGRVGVEGETDTFGIAAPLVGIGIDIAHFFVAMIREFFGYFQWGIIYLLYSVSPLMLAFLAHPSTNNIGVRFLTTSFGVMMWLYGFVFADIIFIGAYSQIVWVYAVAGNDPALTNFMVQTFTEVFLSLGVAVWLIIMLFILLILYFLAPLLVYLIFSGASPAPALGAAIASTVGAAVGYAKLSSQISAMKKGPPTGQGGNNSPPSPLMPMAPLSSGSSSSPMMGLAAEEVSQREQERK